MRPLILSLITLILLVSTPPKHDAQQRAMTQNMRVHTIRSKVLSKDRYVVVWLPPGYDQDAPKRYPVFYMNDGQNKFINWRIDEIAQALIEAKEIEPLILVGVYHGGTQEDRYRDYTPTHTPAHRMSGKAGAYGRMLVEEVKPFIDAEYRTLADAANTGLGGASLGGLVSLYLGLEHPAVFGRLAVISPSVWWDDRMIIKRVKKLPSKQNLRIWLDIGTGESDQAVEDVKQLCDALTARGWAEGADLSCLVLKGAEHNDKAFAGRAGQVLKYLFPAQAKSGLQ
ncbi:MAG TPA: alpha/beta hydrolase-fold protein [Blastocatellia bacterium]|nr:alpha/beta hydrolase-fold protein [Blastocatellia bacterium]